MTNWSTYHLNNVRHTETTNRRTLSSPQPAWTSSALDGAVYGEPLVIGSRVVVTTEKYGLDINTGATVSTLDVGTMTHFTTPTIAGDRLLIAATNRIVAFKPQG